MNKVSNILNIGLEVYKDISQNVFKISKNSHESSLQKSLVLGVLQDSPKDSKNPLRSQRAKLFEDFFKRRYWI